MADPREGSSRWIGTVLHDKWHIDARIARGGVATVYRATHRQGQVAAIKIMHPEYARNEEVRKRFLREGYAANKVGHRGVVRVLDDDVTADGSAYIVMELLQHGEALEDKRERLGGRLPIADAVDVCHQVLDVLAVAHEKGIIHRDIKPENIFVLDDGSVKVLDFGIAHLKEITRQQEATKTGLMLGTPEYMSPEQVLGKRGHIDAQTDVYAVGATLFTLLSGEAVHLDENLNALLVATASRQARSLASVAFKELPRPLIAVVDKALALEKPRRWESARAMQIALREVVPASPSAVARAAAMQRTPSTEVSAIPKEPAAAPATGAAAIAAAELLEPIDGPASMPTLKNAPPSPPARSSPPSRAPNSFVPSSGPTAVIPVRPPRAKDGASAAEGASGDPWTDELSADDLDAPTVATTGSGPALQSPALRSAVVARPLGRDDRVTDDNTATMNRDPLAGSGQRPSVVPPRSAVPPVSKPPATPRLLPSPYGPPPKPTNPMISANPMQATQSMLTPPPKPMQSGPPPPLQSAPPPPMPSMQQAPWQQRGNYTGPPPPMRSLAAPSNAPPPMTAPAQSGPSPLVAAGLVAAAVVLLALAFALYFLLRAE